MNASHFRTRMNMAASPARYCVMVLAILSGTGPTLGATYYVNDTNTVGDVYCSQPGDAGNDGLDPSTPKLNLNTLLSTYDLAPGETVYVDTGDYNGYEVTFGVDDSDAIIQGSTNGTVFDRQASAYGFLISGGTNLTFRDLTIRGASQGVRFSSGGFDSLFERVTIRNNSSAGMHLENCGDGLTLRNCIFANHTSGDQNGVHVYSSSATIENSTFYNNTRALSARYSALTVTNCILHIGSGGSGQIGFWVANGSYGQYTSDYNLFWLTNGASLAKGNSLPTYQTFSEWQNSGVGSDSNSISGDPLFADAAGADFHLQSVVGRWDGTNWVTDAQHSLGIDTGDPEWEYASEPSPNGSRANMGAYGNTWQASKSATNAWLTALTFNAGGTASGTAALQWLAQNLGGGATVAIDYSPDAGSTWTNIATGLTATQGIYSTWDTTDYEDSAVALWRVVHEQDASNADTNDQLFAVRNAPLSYYVNDTNTSGDVHCTAAGDAANSGGEPSSPLDRLDTLLATYDLQSGDTVYMDTGVYDEGYTVTFDVGESGITVQGSTNGTVFNRNGSGFAFYFNAVSDMTVRDLTLRGGSYGAYFGGGGTNCVLERVTIRNNSTTGLHMENSGDGLIVRNCVFADHGNATAFHSYSAPTTIANTTFYNNRYTLSTRYTSLTVTNCILYVGSAGQTAYWVGNGGYSQYVSDYNLFHVAGSAYMAKGNGPTYPTLDAWQESGEGEDLNSVGGDPLFADAAGDDFHLKSAAGRWDGTNWVTDSEHSVGIDIGDPEGDYANEQAPNGGRVNVGRYANTWQASKSPTNAWLTALTYNAGGVASGTETLRWLAQNLGGSATVTIDYSPDAGGTWTNVASGLLATQGIYSAWDTTDYQDSPIGLWRVVHEQDTANVDTNDKVFAVRNSPLAYYVNDTNTSGDVYCTAAGDAANNGGTPSSPLDRLDTLLTTYDLRPGDTVYMDTGTYDEGYQVTFDEGESGIVLQGSSNETVYNRNASGYGFVVNGAAQMTVRDLTIRGARYGVFINNAASTSNLFERVTFRNNSEDGFHLENSGYFTIVRNCVFAYQNTSGFHIYGASSATIENATFYNNKQAVNRRSGAPTVRNCILYMGSSGQIGLSGGVSGTTSDYNLFHIGAGAHAASQSSPATNYTALADWQAAYGQDSNSVTNDPLFADAASDDFHLKSRGGRWNPGTQSWVTDSVTSPGLDAGDPASDYSQETSPNGRRVNLGAYGNTWQASRTVRSGTVLIAR